MDHWLLQSMWALGLPATVSLGAVALVGYVFGQRTRPLASDQLQLRREVKRARGIIRDLERVAQQVRRDLARHQGSLGKFRTRLRDLCERGEQQPVDLLATETDKLMEPTQNLTIKLAQAYEMIRQQANQLSTFGGVRTDNVTGLANRQALDEMLANQIEMNRQYGLACSVVMMEIHSADNDESGCAQRMDTTLKQVGEVLDQYARESDLVCRYGGEEFVAVLPGTSLAGAVAFAERMRATLERLSPVTISCGVAEVMETDDASRLIARADTALYSAKAAGRNQVYQHTGRSVASATPQARLVEKSTIIVNDREQAARETIRSVAQTIRFNDGTARLKTPIRLTAADTRPADPVRG